MRLLITALLVLASGPALAAETPEEETVTWYDVELVVFRNLDTRSSESWPTDGGVPAVEKARPLFPPSPAETGDDAGPDENGAGVLSPDDDPATAALPETPTPFVPLDDRSWQLTGIVDSLQRSSKYEPILHVAWTQPPLDREQSPYLRVTLPGALQPQLPETETPSSGEEPLLGQAGDDEPVDPMPFEPPEFLDDAEQEPPLARPLDGIVQLSVSRYLHLDLDLVYLPENFNRNVLDDVPAATREWTEDERREREQRHRAILDALARGDITLEEAEILALEPDEDVFQGFRLNQYRRLRSGEIHYFDHPVYGAIVKVTPREVPARMLDTNVSGAASVSR